MVDVGKISFFRRTPEERRGHTASCGSANGSEATGRLKATLQPGRKKVRTNPGIKSSARSLLEPQLVDDRQLANAKSCAASERRHFWTSGKHEPKPCKFLFRSQSLR